MTWRPNSWESKKAGQSCREPAFHTLRLGFVFLGGNGNLVLQVPTPEFVFSWEREFVPIVSGPEEIPFFPLADKHAALGQH